MLRQFNGNPYFENFSEENIGFITRTVDVGGRSVQLQVRSFIYCVFLKTIFEFNLFQVWDSYGRDSHRETSESYYRGAHAFIVIYDISDWVSSNIHTSCPIQLFF